ncbi:hypothetical protein B0H14DRAFT_3163152 [Mycena olivaceomarginata]|nr:hypothetical protein B0H14DRAFT_3163152 [Mycena olivaceomarginata]
MAMVESRAPSSVVWGSAAVPAHPSADQRRRTAAAHHRAFGPATGASMPRGPHRPFSTSRLSSAAIKPPRQLSFAIWPFPMLNPQHADTEHYELYPTDPRLVGSESAILLTVFEKYQLLFDFTLPSKPDGGEDKDLTFYAQLHERLTQHMADHHLHFSGSGVSPSMAALPPAASHGSSLAPGIKPKPGFHRKISATPISWYQFSGAHLTPRNHWTPLVDAINPNGLVYFIGPKHGPLKGPLQGQTVPHMCFPLRIQHELEDMFMPGMTQIADECLDSCPSDSGSPLPSPRIGAQAASGVGLPVFCTAATDQQLRPQLWPKLVHPVALCPPRQSTVDLALSGASFPEPSLHTAPLRSSYRSQECVTLSSAPIYIEATDAHTLMLRRHPSRAAVHALLIHFESFFGGDPYIPCYESDAVVIEPSSQLGLFARRSSWKSGDALGPGVRRGILNGLMDAVFANSEVWKKIGDTHVVNVSPAGIVPDERRLRLLTTYGFACRLYVAIESVLPPPLSLLLAFAVLSPGLEQDVIHNPAVIRMFAPHQVEMLEQWPAKRADFLWPKQTTLIHGPHNYARQILFGCQVAFANSPEIGAFANGFNGPSFGASLKSLLIKMAAGRIQSPQDVLERLDWQSTGDPELQAIEALYRTAFHRYLSGHGIVRHPLLPRESLTEAEREIPDDYPLARALMFLMYTTGSQLLPLSSQTIDMVFFRELGPSGTDYSHSDPANNPERWLDVRIALPCVPVRGHTCFYGVDLPLRGPDVLLRQEIPDDATATDFDAYLYVMFRPASLHMEFGGIAKKATRTRVYRAGKWGGASEQGQGIVEGERAGKQAGCCQQAQCNMGMALWKAARPLHGTHGRGALRCSSSKGRGGRGNGAVHEGKGGRMGKLGARARGDLGAWALERSVERARWGRSEVRGMGEARTAGGMCWDEAGSAEGGAMARCTRARVGRMGKLGAQARGDLGAWVLERSVERARWGRSEVRGTGEARTAGAHVLGRSGKRGVLANRRARWGKSAGVGEMGTGNAEGGHGRR